VKEFLKKLTSRKFLAALVGVVAGLAIVFGIDEGAITAVCGAVMSAASLVAYIAAEGKIDATRAAQTAESVQTAIDAIRVIEDPLSTKPPEDRPMTEEEFADFIYNQFEGGPVPSYEEYLAKWGK